MLKTIWLLACALALCATSCGSDIELIEVTLLNLPAETERLYFELQPQGQQSRGHSWLERGQVRERIQLSVANGLRVRETLRVRAVDTRRCRLAEGEADLDQGAGSTTITLRDTSATSCVLRISVSGSGKVSVPDALWSAKEEHPELGFTDYHLHGGDREIFGALCSKETLLAASPNADAYFVGWSKECTGTEPCAPWQAACASDAEGSSAQTRSSSFPFADGLTEVHAAFSPRQACTVSGFCWLNPQPHGFLLSAVTGFSPRDAWAVGEYGTVMRYNGTAWATLPSSEVGTSVNLHGIWGRSANDLWIVGDGGTILRWDGRSFTQQASSTGQSLRGVWGSGSSPTFVVGQLGGVLSCPADKKLSCTQLPSGAGVQLGELFFTAVFGFGADDVYMAGVEATGSGTIYEKGAAGVLLRWDGQRLSRMYTYPSGTLLSLWGYEDPGTSQRKLWISTGDGHILRREGSEFIAEDVSAGSPLRGISGTPPARTGGQPEVWAVTDNGRAVHLHGGRWELLQAPTRELLVGSWSSGADLWAVGTVGTMTHWNGAQFVDATGGKRGLPLGRWLRPQGDLFITHEDASFLTISPRGIESGLTDAVILLGMYGLGNELFAINSDSLYQYEAPLWVMKRRFMGPGAVALAGSAANDFWAVGSKATLYHLTDLGVASASLQPDVQQILLENPTIKRDQEGAYNNAILQAVWVERPDRVWAVGDAGLITLWNGASISGELRPVRDRYPTYYGVWGSGPGDLWVVGTSGAILHNDGSGWSNRSPCPPDPNVGPLDVAYLDVSGTGPDDVWIVGGSIRPSCGSVYRWNGSRLCRVSGVPQTIRWVATRGREVYLITAGGGVLHMKNKDLLPCE